MEQFKKNMVGKVREVLEIKTVRGVIRNRKVLVVQLIREARRVKEKQKGKK